MQTKSRAVKSLSMSNYLITCVLALGFVLAGTVVGATPASADPAGGYRMYSPAQAKCLDVRYYGPYGAYGNACNGYNNQRWNMAWRSGEFVNLQSQAGDTCLSARDDAGITVETCNPGDFRQRFRDSYLDGTRHIFRSFHGSHLQRCLRIEPDGNVGTLRLDARISPDQVFNCTFNVYPF